MASTSGPREGNGTAKSLVAEQICQIVQSTSNLLHLMQQSCPAQAHLEKLPKNLVAKASLARNTEKVLEQLPGVISALDEFTENSLQSVSHLKTVSQVLSNMENSQLRTVFQEINQKG